MQVWEPDFFFRSYVKDSRVRDLVPAADSELWVCPRTPVPILVVLCDLICVRLLYIGVRSRYRLEKASTTSISNVCGESPRFLGGVAINLIRNARASQVWYKLAIIFTQP